MSARVRRTARSLTAVFVAFWAYRLLVAPWIDPSFVMEAQSGPLEPRNDRTAPADEERHRRYARIFAPGSWELDDPIMLESQGVELLMKDYENLPGGQIRLPQCTMLFTENREGGDLTNRRIIVLRAHEGAILQFDSELNLRRGKVGKLIGGRLNGQVTIDGTPSKPGADDALFVAARDVQMDEQKVWSHSNVDFRYGPNEGHGRELVIRLAAGGLGAGAGRGSIGGFERLELLHDVNMHLQPASTGLFPGDSLSATTIVPLPDPATGQIVNDSRRIDISCQGPFTFDMARREAAFKSHVSVDRAIAPSIHDRMTCDELRIFFGDRPRKGPSEPLAGIAKARENGKGNAAQLSLQIERFVARGNAANQVVIAAPSNELTARADELEYEVPRRRVRMEAAPKHPEAVLNWKNNRFGGRSLVVERPPNGALPSAVSNGAGWCEVADENEPGTVITARWSRALLMEPTDDGHLLSLLGNAYAKSKQTGELSASEIKLWLLQTKQPGGAPQAAHAKDAAPVASAYPLPFAPTSSRSRNPVAPSRLLAQGNVRFDSPRLSGDAQTLDVRFDPVGAQRTTSPRHDETPTESAMSGLPLSHSGPQLGASPGQNVRSDSETRRWSLSRSAENSAVDAVIGPSGDATRSIAQSASQQHFELHGNSILVELVSQGVITNVNHVTIDGRVRLRETRTAQPGELPVEIQGDWLQVRNAAVVRQTVAVVSGKPASIVARGMELRGGEIHLDRGRNLLWIEGAGRTVLPANQVVTTSPAAGPTQAQTGALDSFSRAPLVVTFDRGMTFNGEVARFESNVKAQSESQTIHPSQPMSPETHLRSLATDLIEVKMRKPIDLGSDTAAEKAEVDQIACFGPVIMNERTSDHRGVSAIASLTTRDLSIQQLTGEIHAVGPGTLESTRLESDDSIAVQSGLRTSAAAGDKPEGPVYVRIDYQGPVTGNSQQGQLVLHDDIRGVYGPVAHWNDKLDLNAKERGPREIGFFSDVLTARQSPGAQPKTTALELEAGGNVEVYGQTFSAQANRLTYVQDKKQLVFEGDSRSGAELYYQPQVGSTWTRARAARIEYWPATRQTNIHDAQFLDLGQIGDAGPSRLPSAAR